MRAALLFYYPQLFFSFFLCRIRIIIYFCSLIIMLYDNKYESKQTRTSFHSFEKSHGSEAYMDAGLVRQNRQGRVGCEGDSIYVHCRMTELSLSSINAIAPYHLRKSELGGFDFDVEAGLTYNIALIEDYTFGNDFETYMLNVLPHSMEEYDRIRQDHSVKVRKDDKIKKTVIAVLEEAMKNQNIVIDYVCLSEDERQDYRARLFEGWFRKYADDSRYHLLTTSIKIGDVTNYLGAFLRRDNPLFDAFCSAFEQFDRDIHKEEPWNVQITEY